MQSLLQRGPWDCRNPGGARWHQGHRLPVWDTCLEALGWEARPGWRWKTCVLIPSLTHYLEAWPWEMSKPQYPHLWSYNETMMGKVSPGICPG